MVDSLDRIVVLFVVIVLIKNNVIIFMEFVLMDVMMVIKDEIVFKVLKGYGYDFG